MGGDFDFSSLFNEENLAVYDFLDVRHEPGTGVPVSNQAMQRCTLSSSLERETKMESHPVDAQSCGQSVPLEPAQNTEKLATSSNRRSRTRAKKRIRISRKRPFKNVRERRRRAEIKTKFEELHNAIACATPKAFCGAKGSGVLSSSSENED